MVYLETESDQDMVVLCPHWLCGEVIGQLLSHDRITHSRPTGCFTPDDIQMMFGDTDASDLLIVMEALEVCTQCDNDGDMEYEFPCLNFVETLHGLWEKDSKRYGNAVYGGVRIQCPRGFSHQLVHLFPRIQVHLRRNILTENNNPDNDLYQWHHGTKYCSGSLESLITLEQSDQVIEVKTRGPKEMGKEMFDFFEDICEIVERVIEDCCPGIQLEKHVLSPIQLKEHHKTVHSYAPRTLLQMQLDGYSNIKLDDDKEESFIDLVCFGSQEIRDYITLGIDLHISYLSIHTRRLLSMRLDPPEPMGRDWCLLAVSLGLTDNVPDLDDSKRPKESRTDRTLEEWSHETSSTVAQLIVKLRELSREDVIDVLLNTAPLYRVFHSDPSQEDGGAPAPSTSSNNTLSSVSR